MPTMQYTRTLHSIARQIEKKRKPIYINRSEIGLDFNDKFSSTVFNFQYSFEFFLIEIIIMWLVKNYEISW